MCGCRRRETRTVFRLKEREMGSFVDAALEIFKEEKKRPTSNPAR
jgi:hypothetical protein